MSSVNLLPLTTRSFSFMPTVYTYRRKIGLWHYRMGFIWLGDGVSANLDIWDWNSYRGHCPYGSYIPTSWMLVVTKRSQ